MGALRGGAERLLPPRSTSPFRRLSGGRGPARRDEGETPWGPPARCQALQNQHGERSTRNYFAATAEGWPPVVTGEPTNPSTPTVESKLNTVMVDAPRLATYK